MRTYKSPDVYVEEIPIFPPSVAEVGTAIPAFIGYTERAKRVVDDDLLMKPIKIYSFLEYETLFGFPKADEIKLKVNTGDMPGTYTVTEFTEPSPKYLLYYSLKMYFDNGGGQCYVVSVGPYADPASIDAGDLKGGLDAVALEDEPTLIVIPEAVHLGKNEYASVVTAVLAQCGKLKDRFGIFDLYRGTGDFDEVQINEDRKHFGIESLKYGAAYFPFLKTSLNFYVQDGDEATAEKNVKVTDLTAAAPAEALLPALKTSDTAVYNAAKAALKDHYVVLPPSGAVAGVYAAVDGSRGVWKAPANVSLTNVIEPMVKVDSVKQEGLNVDPTSGKSINAIRAFAGKGNLVWGARTLAGNDNEWRYVSVRRFFSMVEESVKKSTYWAVFEPNDANTWVKVRGMIESYLTDKWRDGALAGATPKEAFFVRCGLGSTMNSQDILEGRMNVEIGMAAVRPAEFIILKFSHKLQTS